MMRLRDERGFTLIELLVTMAVTTIVFGTTLAVLDVFQSNNRFDQLRNENQDMARTTLDRLSRQLRNIVARTTSSGIVPGALEQAEEYAITFQTIDTTKAVSGKNATNAMRVRYCLEDSNPENEILWEEVTRWKEKEPELPSSTACPDRTSGDWETLTQVVPHVTNRIGDQGSSKDPSRWLFTYSAKETPEILSVEADLFININPKQTRPGESELTSGISLRNANRRPIAEFTATEESATKVNTRYIHLNASASYDPDGLSLTYKWWDNGAELLTTSQQYVTKELTVGTTQRFKLEVTNPGGLSAYTEKELTIK
jgi:prepilin-type N-terminal cleavage/methylation domain-containing protein